MLKAKLGEVLEVQSGFAFKTEYFTTDVGLPLIRIRDLPNASTEINYRGEYREEFIVEQGEYLIGMDGNFRCFRWNGPRGLLNQRVCRLCKFKKNIEPEYVYYGIQKKLFEIERTTSFATVKHISAKQVLNIELPFPPLPEQRRIVDLLSRAEGIVRLRKEAEKKAAGLVQGIFLEMFGDPATNPKGWAIADLDSVAKIISGATKGRRFEANNAVELPYMRVANVKDGHLDLAEIKTIAVKRCQVEKYRLRPGDLLLTEGGDPDKLGRGALWSGEIEVCLHQNHIFKVRADRSQLLPEFLCELIGSRYGKNYFLRVAKKTTGIATINRTQLGRFPVVMPPPEFQQSFIEQLRVVRSIQSQQFTAIAKAQATFDALLGRVFHTKGSW